MEQVSGQERKSRNTAAEELSDNIETIEKTASVVVKANGRQCIACLSSVGLRGITCFRRDRRRPSMSSLSPFLSRSRRMSGWTVCWWS